MAAAAPREIHLDPESFSALHLRMHEKLAAGLVAVSRNSISPVNQGGWLAGGQDDGGL